MNSQEAVCCHFF